jgi:spore germination protein GerM
MSRAMKIALVLLLIGVAAGAIYLEGLHERVLRLARPQPSEAQVHREITQPPVTTEPEKKESVRIFWAAEGGNTLEPVEIELALPAEPEARAKLIVLALIASPPRPEIRTLPADAALLGFYLLDDGTAIADFSDALARATPSGILSEQLTVDSILRTLEANVPGIRRVKILINGQEVDTLAGHADLTGIFELRSPAAPAAASTAPPSPQAPR